MSSDWVFGIKHLRSSYVVTTYSRVCNFRTVIIFYCVDIVQDGYGRIVPEKGEFNLKSTRSIFRHIFTCIYLLLQLINKQHAQCLFALELALFWLVFLESGEYFPRTFFPSYFTTLKLILQFICKEFIRQS